MDPDEVGLRQGSERDRLVGTRALRGGGEVVSPVVWVESELLAEGGGEGFVVSRIVVFVIEVETVEGDVAEGSDVWVLGAGAEEVP